MDYHSIGGALIMPVRDGSFEVNCFWDRINFLEDQTVRRICQFIYIIVSILLAGLLVGLDFAMKAFVRRIIEPLQNESVKAVSTIGDLEEQVEGLTEELDTLNDRLRERDDAILLLEEKVAEIERLKMEDEDQLDNSREMLSQVRGELSQVNGELSQVNGELLQVRGDFARCEEEIATQREEGRLSLQAIVKCTEVLMVQQNELRELRDENLNLRTNTVTLLESISKNLV
ncbi:MAG: hypothetical protein S4CHLAM20_15190 [Chlamydiia bacterium]|nr:hypothetical protein [Chlamydiia bacterium]